MATAIKTNPTLANAGFDSMAPFTLVLGHQHVDRAQVSKRSSGCGYVCSLLHLDAFEGPIANETARSIFAGQVMRRLRERKTPKYSDELPSSPDYVSSHDSPIPDLASVRLSAGQGTDQNEIVVVAELWAGEATLFDPKSGTELAIWFDRGTLRLLMTGCDIKPGSRFGERQTPSLPTTVVSEKTRDIGSFDVKSQVKGGLNSSSTDYSLGLSGQLSAYRSAGSSRVTTTKREQMGTPYIVAGPEHWEINVVGDPSEPHPNVDSGTSRFKYVTTNDRLCDLLVKEGARRIRVQAVIRTFPSNLKYRIHTKSRLTRIRDHLTINQDRIIKIMLKRGLTAPNEEGITLATAQLRPTRSAK